MKHKLDEEHREHCCAIGIPAPPGDLHVDPEEYRRDYRAWQTSLPQAGHAEWHKRALAHAAWRQHVRSDRAAAKFHGAHGILMPTHEHNPWKWALVIVLAALAALLFASLGHAQGVSGTKGGNIAAPQNNNIGAIPCQANAAAPSWTEGRLVFASCDLNGNLRITGSISVGSFADNAAFTAGASSINIAGGWYSSTPTNCTDGSACGVLLTATRHLWTTCDNCSSSSFTDLGAFTPTSTSVGFAGCFFQTTPTNNPLTNLTGGAPQCTANRELYTAFRTTPNVAVPTWAGGTLGAMATYGTSPGAVLVPGVNAFITNIPAVSQSGTWNIGTVTTVTGITNQVDVNLKQIAGGNAQIAANALNSTGTGIQANALVGQLDDTSPNTCTENQFCNARISSKGVLYGQIRDAAGNERGANVDANNNLGVVLPAETTKVIGTIRNVGNVGGVFDAIGQNVAAPANWLSVGCDFFTSPTTITNGNGSPFTCTSAGAVRNDVTSINGVTPLMGAGNTGTGSPRVTLATDNAAIATWGHGATGSAVPANGVHIGGDASGAAGAPVLTAPLVCDQYAKYDASTNGATELVALVASKLIYICGYSFSSSSSTANTLKWVYGTGTNCATGQTAMTPGVVLQAAASTGPIGKVIPVSGFQRGLKTASANALCLLTNTAQAAQAEVWYAQF